MGYHEKKERYARLYSNGLGRWVIVSYRRTRRPDDVNMPKESIRHERAGQIVEVKKASLKLALGDDMVITIGFRSIYQSAYMDHGKKIKASLYYGAHKPKHLKR